MFGQRLNDYQKKTRQVTEGVLIKNIHLGLWSKSPCSTLNCVCAFVKRWEGLVGLRGGNVVNIYPCENLLWLYFNHSQLTVLKVWCLYWFNTLNQCFRSARIHTILPDPDPDPSLYDDTDSVMDLANKIQTMEMFFRSITLIFFSL